MFTSIDLQYSFYKFVLYKYGSHVKNFFLTTHYQDQTSTLILHTSLVIDILWYSIFYFIIQILSTDSDHWIFDIIQIPTSFFNPLTWYNLLTWWYWFLWRCSNNIEWHYYFVLDLLQKTYWLQTKVKHLIVQSKSKALLASEVANFITKMPCPGIGQLLTPTGYSSGLKLFPWSWLD